MANYSVQIRRDTTTIGRFLRRSSLRPRIRRANIPQLLDCGGVVHYTRGGDRETVNTGSYEIRNGDFVSVADSLPSGDAHCVVVRFDPKDPAYIIWMDSYGRAGRTYMRRRRLTDVVTRRNSLEGILNSIASGRGVHAPINDILIVTHANEWSQLKVKLTGRSRGNWTDYNALKNYVSNGSRPRLNERDLRSNANVIIRGCNIGKSPQYLRKLKELFGRNVNVFAPKHIDVFFGRAPLEHMMYLFQINQKTRATNKAGLIGLYQDAGFRDIEGDEIDNTKWDQWIPSRIHPNRAVSSRFSCNVPATFNSRPIIQRIYKYKRHVFPFDPFTITIRTGSPPHSNEDRIQMLKEVISENDAMNQPFPLYEQYGYDSLEDFIDHYNWNFTWRRRRRKLLCRGSIHVYQVRIPITDGSNNLYINALAQSGGRSYQKQDIEIMDSRFFESV